jgi:glutamate synthase domain-containing protein 3
MRIDAKGVSYKELNELIYQAVEAKQKEIILDNVNGQRYIGAGLLAYLKIIINGVPGNDLGAFMDGPTIIVNANGQDGIGNTMNAGKIIIHGDACDICGYSMRGGKIYIKGSVGYRTGIHMKSYKDLSPLIIIGESSRDFLAEYMAGGVIIVLGLSKKNNESIIGNYCGTGMHGGTIYIREQVKDYQLGKEVSKFEMTSENNKLLRKYLKEYCSFFSLSLKEVMDANFIKLGPATYRPYGKLYTY